MPLSLPELDDDDIFLEMDLTEAWDNLGIDNTITLIVSSIERAFSILPTDIRPDILEIVQNKLNAQLQARLLPGQQEKRDPSDDQS